MKIFVLFVFILLLLASIIYFTSGVNYEYEANIDSKGNLSCSRYYSCIYNERLSKLLGREIYCEVERDRNKIVVSKLALMIKKFAAENNIIDGEVRITGESNKFDAFQGGGHVILMENGEKLNKTVRIDEKNIKFITLVF